MKRILFSATILLLAGSVCSARDYVSRRPAPEARCFRSEAVEKTISEVCGHLSDRKLAWMFANCFPNTLDTTVEYSEAPDGTPDTFIITGDIHAMWLRDSGAQVWPYLSLAKDDEAPTEEEAVRCVHALAATDAGTGFMHEAFWKDDASRYTRSWFAWANTLFGELILKTYRKI